MPEENIGEKLLRPENGEQFPSQELSSAETAPEKAPERAVEKISERPSLPSVAKPAIVKPSSPVMAKSVQRQQIETILAEGLEELYATMPPARQAEFKEKGEETAGKIEKLLLKAKVNLKKIVSLIREWLKMIPGVNKFFLEQEAKIKADKVLDVKEPPRE